MMPLSLMKRVVATVDQEWRSPLAEQILEKWGYDEGSVYYFRASANFLFVFQREGKRYFLRFNEISERDMPSLEDEVNILLYLKEKSLHVAHPVRSLENRYIETIATDLGTFYAVVFEALPGKHFEVDELENEQFFKWGSALGQLHQALKEMPEEYRKHRPHWRDQLQFVEETLSVDDTGLRQELQRLREWAEGLPQSEENFGLIHYDFELDNQRWDDGRIGMLDFDDCVTHWYAADIAFALRDLYSVEVDLEDERFQAFLKGYTSETSLEEHWLAELPNFQRMGKLVTYARITRAVDIPESENHPEWLSGLRGKLVEAQGRFSCF